MHPIIRKTLGGLTPSYYFRQLAFGLLVSLFFILIFKQSAELPFAMYLFLIVSTLLYPYSRFVYESVVDFITGNNVFIVNAFVLLFTKAVTMSLCFTFAIFIAPIGLIYLYIRNNKSETA